MWVDVSAPAGVFMFAGEMPLHVIFEQLGQFRYCWEIMGVDSNLVFPISLFGYLVIASTWPDIR